MFSRLKKTISTHPIEYLFIIGLTIYLLSHNGIVSSISESVFKIYFFAPIYFIFIYLAKKISPWAYYPSGLIPLIGIFLIQPQILLDDIFENFWFLLSLSIAIIFLLSQTWQKNNQRYITEVINTLVNLFYATLCSLLFLFAYALLGFGLNLLITISTSDILFRLGFTLTYCSFPLFFLHFDHQPNRFIQTSSILNLFVKIILTPTFFIYTLILFIYLIKILVTGTLPTHTTLEIIMPYVLLGLLLKSLSVLVPVPLQNALPYLIFAPLILLWYCIGIRLYYYGFSSNRVIVYSLLAIATLFHLLSIFPRYFSLRFFAGLCITCCAFFAYVFSPSEISQYHQSQRLYYHLEKTGLLTPNHQLTQITPSLFNEIKIDEKKVMHLRLASQAYTYLLYQDALAPKTQAFIQTLKQREDITTLLTDEMPSYFLEETTIYEDNSLYFARMQPTYYDISSYRYLLEDQMFSLQPIVEGNTQFYQISFNSSNQKSLPPIKFNATAYLEKLFEENNLHPQEHYTEAELKHLQDQLLLMTIDNFVIILNDISLIYEDQQYRFNTLNPAFLLLK